MRSSTKQKQYIQSQLNKQLSIQVNKLVADLDVSEMTIRRDLNDLGQLDDLRKHEDSLIESFAHNTIDSLYFGTFFVLGGVTCSESGLFDYLIENTTSKGLIIEYSKKTVVFVIEEKLE